MSRKEIVLLVSRAIAILQIISALMGIVIALPQQIFIFVRPMLHARQTFAGTLTGAMDLSGAIRWDDLGFLLARIVVQLIIATLFWRCGPWIEQFLAPAELRDELTVS